MPEYFACTVEIGNLELHAHQFGRVYGEPSPRDARRTTEADQRGPERGSHRRLTYTSEGRTSLRQPTPTAGATITAWFAHSQVSPTSGSACKSAGLGKRSVGGLS